MNNKDEINVSEIIIVILIIIIIFVCCYFYKNSNNDTNYNNCYNLQNNIIDCLKLTAKNNPNKCALKIKINKNEWKDITYLEYYKNVYNVAESIYYWLKTNATIGIIGRTSPGSIYSLLGGLMNNGRVICIDDNTTNDYTDIINKYNIELLIIEGNRQLKKLINKDIQTVSLIVYYSPIKENMIEYFDIPLISMGNFLTKRKNIKKNNKNNMLNVIINYSNNKTVSLTHNEIIKSSLNFLNSFKEHTLHNENIISFHSHTNIYYQLIDIFIPIITSSTVWLYNKSDLSKLYKTIKQVNPTIILADTHVWNLILKTKQKTTKQNNLIDNLFNNTTDNLINYGLDKCKISISFDKITMNNKNFFKSIGLNIHELNTFSFYKMF